MQLLESLKNRLLEEAPKLGFKDSSPVAEHEASSENERVYHEIRQTLRVSGVNLVFRTWAGHAGLLPLLWDAIRPNAETRVFEDSADQLRAEAARAAESLGRLNVAKRTHLGESQAYQVRAALELYHYVNPKLLLLTAAVRLALQGELNAKAETSDAKPQRIVLGVPPRMAAMEMEDAKPKKARLQSIFDEIQEALSLPSVNSDYRTLALWPDYLAAAWANLKPIVSRSEYGEAANRVSDQARQLAAKLPLPVALSRPQREKGSVSFDKAVETTDSFAQLLPGLMIHVALCLQDWRHGDELARSPFSAETRGETPKVESQEGDAHELA